MRRMLVVGIGVLGLLLAGCLQIPEPTSPTLLVTYSPDRLTVVLEVVGTQCDRYEWDFGDGESAETTLPKVTHRYATSGLYLVVVKGYGPGGGGTGEPGPGFSEPNALVCQLETIVDTRPAVQIYGIEIQPINPPYWYNPDVWPRWHYPASVALRFRLIYQVHRPQEASIERIQWLITDDWGRLLEAQDSVEWIWYEADTEFIARGCPSRRTEYRAHVTILLTDGSEYKIRQTFVLSLPSRN